MSLLTDILRDELARLYPSGFAGLTQRTVLRSLIPRISPWAGTGANLLRTLWAEGVQPGRSNFYVVWKEGRSEIKADPVHPTYERGGVEGKPFRYKYTAQVFNPETGEIDDTGGYAFTSYPKTPTELRAQIDQGYKSEEVEMWEEKVDYGRPLKIVFEPVNVFPRRRT